jgi:hypothetical protein
LGKPREKIGVSSFLRWDTKFLGRPSVKVMRSTTRGDVLKIPRIQIGTVMLLIAIMALCAAMVAKGRRAAIREEELRAKLASQRVQAVLHSLNAVIKRQTK